MKTETIKRSKCKSFHRKKGQLLFNDVTIETFSLNYTSIFRFSPEENSLENVSVVICEFDEFQLKTFQIRCH